MERISSLNRVPSGPQDLKSEASLGLRRDPYDKTARRRSSRTKRDEDEFEIDRFEHPAGQELDH
jgi:hypothetical protein